MNSWETTVTANVTATPPPGTMGADEKHSFAHPPGAEPPPVLALPLRTRIALWMLLGFALTALAILWERSSRDVIDTVDSVLPRPAAKTSAPKSPSKKSSSATAPGAPAAIVRSPALAEVEVLATLAREDPNFDARAAIAHLKPYADSDDQDVASAAERALQPLMNGLEVGARTSARRAAEKALDCIDDGDFPGAAKILQSAFDALPPDVPWARDHGAAQLRGLIDNLSAQRTEIKTQALKEIEAAWRANDNAAKAAAERWFKYRDPDVREAAEALKNKIEDEQHTALVQKQQRDSAQRQAWLEFFTRFSGLVAEGDLENAAAVAKNSTLATTAAGAVADGEKVLAGCLDDVAMIKRLQDLALHKARTSKRNVSLTLRRGKADGVIDGVEGRQMFLALNGGRIGVKIENVSWPSLIGLFDSRELHDAGLSPVVWILNAYENPADALTALPKAYAASKLRLPQYWAERVRLEKYRELDQDVARKINNLNDAVRAGNADAIKESLEAARPAVKAFEEIEPLSEIRGKVIADAEKIVGKAARSRVILQNGVSPTAEYLGINTDQISQYRDSAKKTDVGVQFGLKAGSSGGVQRILIRCDGLEAAIGKARVRKATLEFYQIESPQSSGSQIALFRLKRAWAPDAGTWISFDGNGKNTDWAIAGASGDADVESKDEAKLTIDTKKNAWRSFDVTAYFQEILTGKAQNLGLLMRVINGEPEHQVRFYPETDLDGAKDKSLRPKLTLEIEAE